MMLTDSLAKRLRSRLVQTEAGCLEYVGARRCGYGAIRGRHDDGSHAMFRANRVAWELAHGPIPPGMFVCHTCDNPPCCHVDHLFLGTPADNMADKRAKGRQASGLDLPHTKLSDEQVEEIRRRYSAGGVSQRGLARQYGVDQKHVSRLVNHKARVGAA